MPNPPRGTYLCVFDNVSLSDPVRVGDFDIRRYTVPELTDLLRGRDDSVTSPAEQRELEHLSWCVWARIELPIDGQSFLGAGGVAELSDMDWARVNFYAQGTFGDPTEPFDKLLRALNLHKPNNGPVFVCDLYLRPAQSIQSKRQVSRIVFSEPMTVPSPPEGKEVPLLRGYYLTMDDGIAISGLVEQLDRCFASNPDRRDAG